MLLPGQHGAAPAAARARRVAADDGGVPPQVVVVPRTHGVNAAGPGVAGVGHHRMGPRGGARAGGHGVAGEPGRAVGPPVEGGAHGRPGRWPAAPRACRQQAAAADRLVTWPKAGRWIGQSDLDERPNENPELETLLDLAKVWRHALLVWLLTTGHPCGLEEARR